MYVHPSQRDVFWPGHVVGSIWQKIDNLLPRLRESKGWQTSSSLFKLWELMLIDWSPVMAADGGANRGSGEKLPGSIGQGPAS